MVIYLFKNSFILLFKRKSFKMKKDKKEKHIFNHQSKVLLSLRHFSILKSVTIFRFQVYFSTSNWGPAKSFLKLQAAIFIISLPERSSKCFISERKFSETIKILIYVVTIIKAFKSVAFLLAI